MPKEDLLIRALKLSNTTKNIQINKLTEDGLKKDREIQALEFRIGLLKRWFDVNSLPSLN